jgi:hypothetical protein
MGWSNTWECKIYALLACLGGAFGVLYSGGEDLWFGVLRLKSRIYWYRLLGLDHTLR